MDNLLFTRLMGCRFNRGMMGLRMFSSALCRCWIWGRILGICRRLGGMLGRFLLFLAFNAWSLVPPTTRPLFRASGRSCGLDWHPVTGHDSSSDDCQIHTSSKDPTLTTHTLNLLFSWLNRYCLDTTHNHCRSITMIAASSTETWVNSFLIEGL